MAARIKKVKITKAQNDVLNQIRGLKQEAFYMVIGARKSDGSYVLEGSKKTFDDLVADLFDEVEYRMQPEAKLKHLRQLIHQISPSGIY